MGWQINAYDVQPLHLEGALIVALAIAGEFKLIVGQQPQGMMRQLPPMASQ